MGRKLFLRHLSEAAATPVPEISNIQNVDEGVIAFQFSYSKDGFQQHCNLRLLAVDVDEYPDGNNYMLYTEDERIDPDIPKAFEILSPLLSGRPIREALEELARGLTDTLTRGHYNNPIAIDDEDVDESDTDDFLEGADSDEDPFGLDDPRPNPSLARLPSTTQTRSASGTSTIPTAKIRSDFRATKEAGFRVGVLGNLSTGGIVCVSIRVSKLGISEEAMKAWGLKRKHYLILLIRFQSGYRDLEQVKEDSTLSGRTEMRVVLCERYKPTSTDAFAAFNQLDQPQTTSFTESAYPLEPLFIGRPLNELLQQRFAKIVSFRESCGFNWPSSESFVNEIQGKPLAVVHNSIENYIRPDDASSKALPPIVTADAMESKLVKNVSLPLVAMQFVLRHFVRCTEFCLVCHCKVGDTFEALKPYVCSRPLCLYQYMALGFGPSIEWELLSQPYVVDLLVSFCYAAAKQGRLKEFPVGIDLRVPLLPHYNDPIQAYHRRYGYDTGGSSKENQKPIVRSFGAQMDFAKGELLLQPGQQQATASLRAGDWIVVHSEDANEDSHYRVEEAMFPVFKLSAPIKARAIEATTRSAQGAPFFRGEPSPAPTRPTTPPKALPKGSNVVDCYCYSQSFDALSNEQKHHAMVTLLDTLPTVLEMQNYLEVDQKGKDPSLKGWRHRISDSALNLLRWIIASNRSCIMQVDRLAQDQASSKITQTMDERVAGMDNWMQFRFAQGAPDKEQRFVDCVKQENDASQKQYPTIFAWHGSPMSNWHSIIRQGLRFDETLHGRAYGDGVYMSSQASTSQGFSNTYDTSPGSSVWPQSVLKVSSAFSLNELVNMPEKFVSRSPHYVVNNIDWIQTRYLFIKSELHHTVGDKPTLEYEQDPKMRAVNDQGKEIQIPITAISKSRRPATTQGISKHGDKKSKSIWTTDQATAEQEEDDANSLISEDEDRALLESDSENVDARSLDGDDFYEIPAPGPTQAATPGKKRALDASQTDFEPGTLDVSSIKFLDPPKDASTSATKALMQWFKDAIKTQESTPLHKLGWFINPDHITNMYQWIVELHSFNEKLPLASDMKGAEVKSIVLEMRFTNQFPFSPPFIRVIKPRFLPFNQGGGGHVTEGGAICMELLTNSGWSAATSVESVLLQVQLAMSDDERPARLLTRGKKQNTPRYYGSGREDSYGVGEAVLAYERACRAHGWKIPEDFNKFQSEDAEY